MTSRTLLIELLVEELPPKALCGLGDAFAGVLFEQLRAQGLTLPHAQFVPFASPRRLAVQISGVVPRAPDSPVRHKLMPVSVGLDAQGNATPALLKKLQSLGLDASVLPALVRVDDGKAEVLHHDSIAPGATLSEGLQKALDEAIARLPIPKVMTYQLEENCAMPGWSSVRFVRPAHGLVALYGSEVVPVTALGLKAGNITQGHRFEAAKNPVVLLHAENYATTLEEDGAVVASFAARRDEIARQLHEAAARAGQGLRPIGDEALLDEVTALVERPNVLICEFEPEFLQVPQECLILTMKANQKYFPLLDAQGHLVNRFLVVSNIRPADASAVVGGNERVVRPRLADARFFFEQDRKKALAERVAGLSRVVYHNKLGSQGERVERVRGIARSIAAKLELDAAQADLAAQLTKADLLTDMVGEFPELQGIMGRYYALADGLPEAVADAIEDHYKPRFAGDTLPRSPVGIAVALADKLETLVGMFGTGNLPTGEKDPFALRRHALGVIRMLMERELPLALDVLLGDAAQTFGALLTHPLQPLENFIGDRLAGMLREQGYSAQEVDAVLALRPQQLAQVPARLQAVRAFAALPEAAALSAANKRIANILKKTEGAVAAEVDTTLLQEQAEKDLYAAMQHTVPTALAQFSAGDCTASLQTLAALRAPVDAFFDGVMVNAEQQNLRHNRLALLQNLHSAMNRVADLSRLAS